MAQPRKSLINNVYVSVIELRGRIERIVKELPYDIDMGPTPSPPDTVGELREMMHDFVSLMNTVHGALYRYDRETNGTETRTREVIHEQVKGDQRILRSGYRDPDGRSEDEILANIAYDLMQLDRYKGLT